MFGFGKDAKKANKGKAVKTTKKVKADQAKKVAKRLDDYDKF